MKNDTEYVRCGIGVFILNDKNEVLLGLRQGSLGSGEWGLPGGKPEVGEDLIIAAKREVKEETNLDITNLEKIDWSNDIFDKENLHYVTLFYLTHCFSGEMINLEGPEYLKKPKCLELKWFPINNLPAELFLPLKQIVENNYNKIIDRN